MITIAFRMAVIVSVLLVAGCSTYNFRKVQYPSGVEKTQFYAYGNYCGPGHPVTSGNRKETLLASSPMDDLDAICYAHDFCYEIDANRVTCDSALHRMVIEHQGEFTGPGCWNTATDLTIAFFGKFWERGKDGSETTANRVVGVALGLPIAAFWMVLKLPAVPFMEDATQGTCNLRDGPDSGKMIALFEKEYADGLFNDGIEIVIPVPMQESAVSTDVTPLFRSHLELE
jgi:hypothetical protein